MRYERDLGGWPEPPLAHDPAHRDAFFAPTSGSVGYGPTYGHFSYNSRPICMEPRSAGMYFGPRSLTDLVRLRTPSPDPFVEFGLTLRWPGAPFL